MVKPANLPAEPHDREGVDVIPRGTVFKSDRESGVITNSSQSAVQIIDIRTTTVELQLNDDIVKGLDAPVGEKTLPTMLLYDEAGLKEFEAITYVDDYYLTNAEIEVLSTCAEEIASRVPHGALLIELGSGNLRKVNILLQALEAAKKNVDYFALDLSRPELERTFASIPQNAFKYVRCFGLHGTYDDGKAWLESNEEVKSHPRFILWLGSSIGNFEREGAEEFLKQWRETVIRPGTKDRMLIAFDSCNDPARVWLAYNDRQRVTERFIMNGLNNANSILGQKVFDQSDWAYIGEYDVVYDRHQAFYESRRELILPLSKPVKIEKGEKVRVERSYKFSYAQAVAMFEGAGLSIGNSWGQPGGEYALHLLHNPTARTGLQPKEYAKEPCPSLGEWEELWKIWDLVTLSMVRKDQYLTKPISLRNPILFYLGHIPTFLDVQLSRTADLAATRPVHYRDIFQRGIDPDVDDPTKCHNHSAIPDTWPKLDDVLDFCGRVRNRVRAIYSNGDSSSVRLQRGLWLGFEHEVMHLETLMYMLLQHDLTVPPAGVPEPDFRAQFLLDSTKATEGEVWIKIPGQKIVLGTNDREEEGGFFTWDNEKPALVSSVAPFEAFSRPITNGEYAMYLKSTKSTSYPKSWTTEGRNPNTNVLAEVNRDDPSPAVFNGVFVKTAFGPVPLTYAQYWPVIASYDELNGCANWMGGRLPTREELQVIYSHTEVVKKDLEAKKLAAMIDAVNGHLSMDGVHITPPDLTALAEKADESGTNDMFANMVGANVSFRRWHPTSVLGKICGRGDSGAWEWSSTVLEKWDGFKAMELYPEYTADFFDTKHNIVLGASWATHSRIAGRKTFVNWYQRNYEFAWCTGRLVRDLASPGTD
ncbi:hypothetical protein TWF225_008485 [Orbilia oligospora]|uniref:Histidine-specific methyltransferase SAM-dependent domain-containing protein n=1 Tax=Orbilia oligospora TaxID=2813651 RepID=A0A4Z0XJV4_ORBOL|nr:hypothetical protein TWF751_002261 [Orbilia oligospora]KAF3157374.1 hypothetical protein TWF751_002261 [Orbilia oligospora]KAF3177085.1 hypothetical protein TWF225_008485 [Orbilia oligospora]KAF3245732.1 hypothetical protein TWF217_010357 [Orbilia oligospora]KAF3249217.1 hypothetical protein TWF128_007893 [Orbilia oligospora]